MVLVEIGAEVEQNCGRLKDVKAVVRYRRYFAIRVDLHSRQLEEYAKRKGELVPRGTTAT